MLKNREDINHLQRAFENNVILKKFNAMLMCSNNIKLSNLISIEMD